MEDAPRPRTEEHALPTRGKPAVPWIGHEALPLRVAGVARGRVAVELPADSRAQAVGTDQEGPVLLAPIIQAHGDPVAVLDEARDGGAEPDAVEADGLHEQRLEILPADPDLRHAVLFGDLAVGPGGEQLAPPAAVLGRLERGTDGLHLVVEPESRERPHGVGPHVETPADLDFTYVVDPLEHDAVHAEPSERPCRREAADAAADDQGAQVSHVRGPTRLASILGDRPPCPGEGRAPGAVPRGRPSARPTRPPAHQ